MDSSKTYTIYTFSYGIEETIEKLGLKRFHLAGSSTGALVSKIYAARNPERIITLGLFDSAGVNAPEKSDFLMLLENGENPFDVKTLEDYDKLNEFGFYEEPFLPWPIHAVMARRYIERNDFYQKMFADLKTSKPFYDEKVQLEILSHLEMPVFIIWGDHDRLLHVSSVDVYQKALPRVETVILENCGHLPMLERPEESAEHYASFLEEHPDG